MMNFPLLQVPRMAMQRLRPPQSNIPPTRELRERLKRLAARLVRQAELAPPLPLQTLRRHAANMAEENGIAGEYRDYIAILINNEAWRDALAAVPYERRLLLLPKCLRVEEHCPATMDEYGLLCKQCGLCAIQDLQGEAEQLGYAVLCAEGSAVVMQLIQTGKIEAIVGVSCLSVLEKAFPHMEAAAIPGMAIPLLQGDCRDTTVDLDWVWDVIHLSSADRTHRLDLDELRQQVREWFAPEALAGLAGPATSSAETVAREWLGRDGKRWRPFLLACVWRALHNEQTPLPDALKKLAIAVECFHKASLIHDDIEDGDQMRYGRPALHVEQGVPVAINAGDLLIGEGYRLIASAEVSADVRAQMLSIAAEGHRTLCLGQGEELAWAASPRPLSAAKVIEVFQQKTAPAFEVALRLGAACAEADASVGAALSRYSSAMGVAYQIQDDLSDLADESDLNAMRPTLPLALAWERSAGADRDTIEAVWRRAASPEQLRQARRIMQEMRIDEACLALLEHYKQQALNAIAPLESASLRGLLRRVVGKIFGIEIKGWCSESGATHA